MIVDTSTPQPQAIPTPGVRSSQDIVDHLDKVLAAQPPEVKAAVDHAHGIMGLQSPIEVPANDAASPMATSYPVSAPEAPQPITASPAGASPIATSGSPTDARPLPTPGMIGVRQSDLSAPAPSAASAPFIAGSPDASPTPPAANGATPSALANPHMQNLERMTTDGTGTNKIHNPFLRGLATVGDAIGSGLFPEFTRFIPGFSAHHQQLIGDEESQLGQEQKATKATDESRLHNAQAAVQEALPELNETKAELAATKATNTREIADQKHAMAEAELERKRGESKAKIDAHLRDTGFMEDKDGNIVAVPYEQMSQKQKDAHDTNEAIQTLKSSQSELADASAAFAKAKKDNIPVAMEMAQKRIDTARVNASRAQERLGLSEKTFEARYHGTEGGEALPGAMIGDDGKPVGTAFQSNVRPTGTERNKGDLANSAAEQVGDLKDIVKKRPDIFGPAAGRKTDFTVWLGSQDPDAQRFRAARTIAGDHLAGVFGGRSESALKALDDAIGHFKDNPEAINAGLDQVLRGNSVFQKAGTVKTAGSDASHATGSGAVHYMDGTTEYDIPADKIKAFESKHPNAKKQ